MRVCACGSDPTDKENSFVQLMETRPEGFKHLSLDGSPGVVEALAEAGVRTRTTDPQHCDLHMETITGCTEQLFQLNPVGMGTSRALLLSCSCSRSRSRSCSCSCSCSALLFCVFSLGPALPYGAFPACPSASCDSSWHVVLQALRMKWASQWRRHRSSESTVVPVRSRAVLS